MGPNRITRGGAASRALILLAAAALGLSACGSGGETTTVAKDTEADAAVLREILGRQLAAIDAYGDVLPALRGADLAIARRFRAQEQEHVDAIVKALHGLGEKTVPADEEIESEGLKTEADGLGFLYEVESASVAYGLRAISHLTYPWPRSLLGSIVANQAQHLVVLRRQLGADLGESIPRAFEDGTAPPPSKEGE